MAYAFHKKNTVLDSNQYIKNLKNNTKTYNHLFTKQKISNQHNKYNKLHTHNNIIINDVHIINSLNNDYNTIINNYDNLYDKLDGNTVDLNNLINKINQINYNITLNEEKLNIYIKKLNQSDNLNNEYQLDILELEKTNDNNQTQIDLLESYYKSIINKQNLNLENLDFNYRQALENNKNLELDKLILKENKERLLLEDELKKNELIIIKKKLEKEETNNEKLDDEIQFYETEILNYKKKVSEKNKQIDIYNAEKIKNLENIDKLKSDIDNILLQLEEANNLAIENKKTIELNTIKLKEAETKKKEILEHSKYLDTEYKKSIEELNNKLIQAKLVASTSKNELDLLLQNNNLIEEKYLQTLNELTIYKNDYNSLKDEATILNNEIYNLQETLNLKKDIETKLNNTVEQFTVLEIEKQAIEEKLNDEKKNNTDLKREITNLKNNETILLSLIENSDIELKQLKKSYSIILENKKNETDTLTNKLNLSLEKLKKIQEEFNLKNELFDHIQTENETIKNSYNTKFKEYIDKNEDLSLEIDKVNIENIKLKILSNQLKHISFAKSETTTHSTALTSTLESLETLIKEIFDKHGHNNLISEYPTAPNILKQHLGSVYIVIFDIVKEISKQLDITVEETPVDEEPEDDTIKPTLAGKFNSFGSKTKFPIFSFSYDATKLLKPEWRWYILTYGYPHWEDETVENQTTKTMNINKNKVTKLTIYQRIQGILQVIGKNEIPPVFYNSLDQEFKQDATTVSRYGIRTEDHALNGNYEQSEEPI